ncbi:MAG TPA: type II toxin-antitoxin system VapC family toxin [Rugosimonospora sp.]|nr:type II toxin-antitoxin system VapC family toxin [Rugosimonospora sp.]
MIYLDTSAILKLLHREAESEALAGHLETHGGQDLITSALATVETARALRAVGAVDIAASAIRTSDQIVIGKGATIPAIAMTSAVLNVARTLPPEILRSLGAIHLATASLIGPDLHHLITYDKRMIAAAEVAGLPVEVPR